MHRDYALTHCLDYVVQNEYIRYAGKFAFPPVSPYKSQQCVQSTHRDCVLIAGLHVCRNDCSVCRFPILYRRQHRLQVRLGYNLCCVRVQHPVRRFRYGYSRYVRKFLYAFRATNRLQHPTRSIRHSLPMQAPSGLNRVPMGEEE
jgi:hypothetical protein